MNNTTTYHKSMMESSAGLPYSKIAIGECQSRHFKPQFGSKYAINLDLRINTKPDISSDQQNLNMQNNSAGSNRVVEKYSQDGSR